MSILNSALIWQRVCRSLFIAAQADLVEKYHLGKVVDSLAEASEWVQSVTEDQYRQLADHVYRFGWLNRQGMFTKRALTEAVFQARLEE